MRTGAAAVLLSAALLEGCTVFGSGGAKYQSGSVQVVATEVVGSHGGTVSVARTGTPLDGIEVRFPAGAVPDNTPIEVAWDHGTLADVSGTPSGVIVRLVAGDLREFAQHIEIRVTFNPTQKPKTVMAYSIDDQGRLHTLDVATFDSGRGEALIWTFQPVRFTWVLVN